MKQREAIEKTLAELRGVRENSQSEQARASIGRALDSKQNVIVAAAAEIVADVELEGFAADLCAAFERFLAAPWKRDPGCRAKAAVARALYRTAAPAAAVFLRGIRHVQPEPIWGGSQDTAIELRGVCGLGLVRCGYPDALTELADLLADPEPMARAAAAQAIAYSERHDVGVPLLRFKALCGDVDPRVTSACFSGLLALAPEGALAFVGEFLHRPSIEVREAALLALGESRQPRALELLQAFVERTLLEGECTTALLAIALLRCDAAWDYLIELVRAGSPQRARAALDALATYREDAGLRDRVLAAVGQHEDSALQAHARTLFKPQSASH